MKSPRWPYNEKYEPLAKWIARGGGFFLAFGIWYWLTGGKMPPGW